jgi:hypothetical protein
MLHAMPVLSRRARLLMLATLLAFAAGILLVALLRSAAPAGADLPSGSAVPSTSAHSSAPSTPSSTATPAPTPEAEVLLAVGDIGSCDGETDEAVASLASSLPGSIALLGDIAYPDGTTENFESCFEPAWGPMRPRLHPAPGNHEYETPEASAYFAWFGAAAGQPGQGWYSWDLGAWHLVALNSNCAFVGGCGPGSPQLAWLEADLAASDAECLLAYWHAPRHSSGRHGSLTHTDPLWVALVGAGMDVALAGHDHSYERLVADGVREFVVGTGGRSLYAFEQEPLPTTEVRHDDSYGLLRLDLGDGGYEWEFLPAGNSPFSDSGTGDCG